MTGLEDAERPGRVLGRAVVVSASSFLAGGLVIACLTLALNPQIHGRAQEAFLLAGYFALAYGTIGGVLGLVAGAALALAGKVLPPWAVRHLESAVLAVLGLAPLVYVALLPDSGLTGNLLTGLLFRPARLHGLLRLALFVLALALCGPLLRRGLGAVAGRRLPSGWSRRQSAAVVAAAVLGLGVGLVWIAAGPRLERLGDDRRGGPAETSVPADASPVLLLCIDGADLDDVILPMVEAGELPAFARLMREGTWGELATFEPTLSPAVWTTLVTGKAKAAHGIHGFTLVRLPGLAHPILEFPLHAGLNFRLVPLLERLPGVPQLRRPFTSDLRRVPALWDIVGRFATVGVFRWRVSWPIEPINGFGVAVPVTLGEAPRRPGYPRHLERYEHPAALLAGFAPPPPLPDLQAVAPYLAPGTPIVPEDERIRLVHSSLSLDASHYLPRLLWRFKPRFTAADFYSVDAFNHYFTADRSSGGPFAPALAERYRFTDERLGELLERLGSRYTMLVVSDHGYDFERNNHAHAPAGVFFARGRGFAPGRQVAGLSVFDMAPLVLHLLGLPGALDMPSVASGSYRRALDPGYLRRHPIGVIPSWGTREGVAAYLRDEDLEREVLEELRALGYIE